MRLTISVITGLAAVQPGFADEIHKTTNSDGTVSYSNVAPDTAGNSEVIDAYPEPSAADQQAAQQRLREIQSDIEQRRIERTEAAEESTTEEADDNTDSEPPSKNKNFIGVAPFI